MAENDRRRILRRGLEACVLGEVEALPELFNGQRIEIGAAIGAEFTADKISAFRNYFDDAALLEQLLIA